MILVVGATGHLGSEICRLLLAKGNAVRALIRATSDQSAVERLKNMGTTLVQGDLRDRASLEAACKGATAVISTATAIARPTSGDLRTVDAEGQLALVDAARAAGVRRFVYVSYSGNLREDCPLHDAKRAVESSLKARPPKGTSSEEFGAGGMTYTILRPTFFMEIWLSPHVGFDAANAKATIYGEGKNKVSWISFRDVAQFAVQALENPAAQNATIELGGPEQLSPLEVVRVFEQVGGRSFQIQHVPEDALRAQKSSATDPVQQTFFALMLGYAKGDPIEMQETLKTYPVRLTSVHDWAVQVLRR